MFTYEGLFARRWREAIVKLREERLQRLALGAGIDTFETYRESVGYLAALNQVLELAESVEVDLRNREKMTERP